MTRHDTSYDETAKSLVDRIGKNIVIGIPLGLGKPVGVVNALYRLAIQDPSLKLTILTALTLARPETHSDLEKRFVEPFLDRILGDYEELLYEAPRLKQQLPANITVIEFFLSTAKFLHNNYVQQNYISSAYANVVRDILNLGLNVMAQQVAHSTENPDLYSVSCNSDLFRNVQLALKNSNKKHAIVGEVNNNLPFMYGEAVNQTDVFSNIVDTGTYRTLFSVPHEEVEIADHLIGLYTSALIKDDSCLQIGIGKLSNALANSLIMRHKENSPYQELLNKLFVAKKFPALISDTSAIGTFEKGIYASTEMLCDAYLYLLHENILKKRVYDHAGLQSLLNAGKISENFSDNILEVLTENKIIHAEPSADDVEFLRTFGILKSDVNAQDLKQKDTKEFLGKSLQTGKFAHAAFFLGTGEMYQFLRDMPKEKRLEIDMTSVTRTNSLLWNPELLALQRQNARFVNSAMMVTLGGVVISDGLTDMREVSGVGGQFDFVNMALNLPGSRSIINCRSTRINKGTLESNIVWEYSNMTITRFLRDIIITEYGIADCRSKVDADIIKEMLNVADSRFQEGLLAKAKLAGKISKDYEIPQIFRNNYPEAIHAVLRDLHSQGYFQPYPFGTEMTDVEQVLVKALLILKSSSKLKLLGIVFVSLFFFNNDAKYKPYLKRMGLEKAGNFKNYLNKKILTYVLHRVLSGNEKFSKALTASSLSHP